MISAKVFSNRFLFGFASFSENISNFKRISSLLIVALLLSACQGGGGTGDASGIVISNAGQSGVDQNYLNIEILSPLDNYTLPSVDTITVGKTVYMDRDYTFTNVPYNYDGLPYIRTANDDKYNTEPDYLQFKVNKPVTVFVGFTNETDTLPSWLETWTNTGEQLDLSAGSRQVYKKEFPAGTVILGGNEVGFSMYVVMIKDNECTDNYSCEFVQNKEINLSWNRNPDSISGYNIYYGTTIDTVNTLVSEVPLDTAGFDSQMPSTRFKSWDDFSLQHGESACFRVSAYNDYGESSLSTPACISI